MTAIAAHDHDDDRRQPGDEADRELEEEPRRDGEDDDREGLDEERGAGLLCLHTPQDIAGD